MIKISCGQHHQHSIVLSRYIFLHCHTGLMHGIIIYMVHTYVPATYTHTYVCTYTYVYKYMYMHASVRVYGDVSTHTYVHMIHYAYVLNIYFYFLLY